MKKYLSLLLMIVVFSSTLTANDDEMLDEFNDEFNDEFIVQQEEDIFGGYNRVMTSFNDGVYEYFLLPVSNGYKQITHEKVREGVDNVFENLLFPIRFINNLLQGKINYAGEELGRFVINSTIGIAGIFDVAKDQYNLHPHNEDFGQTLGYWGIGSGSHIVLPFFGPSNLRDIVGFFPDSYLNPTDYYESRRYNLLDNSLEATALKIYSKINSTAMNDQYGILKKDAVDLYPYLKNSYEQYRNQQIKE